MESRFGKIGVCTGQLNDNAIPAIAAHFGKLGGKGQHLRSNRWILVPQQRMDDIFGGQFAPVVKLNPTLEIDVPANEIVALNRSSERKLRA